MPDSKNPLSKRQGLTQNNYTARLRAPDSWLEMQAYYMHNARLGSRCTKRKLRYKDKRRSSNPGTHLKSRCSTSHCYLALRSKSSAAHSIVGVRHHSTTHSIGTEATSKTAPNQQKLPQIASAPHPKMCAPQRAIRRRLHHRPHRTARPKCPSVTRPATAASATGQPMTPKYATTNTTTRK
jgi:hypothetical protein